MSQPIPPCGVFTAIITPMHEDGAIDWHRFDQLVEEQIASGVNGLVPVGTTGESPTLDNDEHLEVIARTVRAVAGRVPVIAGTGANSTSEALFLTREADRLGADAFLQVAPYYNKPSQEGVFQHFSKIAECTGKPIMLYSIPGRCGIEIETATVARLADAHANIRHIKEAGGKADKVAALRRACPEVAVWCGDDGLISPFVDAGAVGIVSVAANLAPETIVEYFNACFDGESDRAERIFAACRALLTDLVFMDGNPVTIKEAMHQAGKLTSPSVRLPLVRTTVKNREAIKALLTTIGLPA